MFITKYSFLKLLFSLLSVMILMYSCQSKSEKNDFKPVNDTLKLAKNKPIINAIGVVLNEESVAIVENWKEFQDFDQEISTYYAITPSAALLNAVSLNQKAESLLESIRQPELNNPSTLSRFNLLVTETKRLADMSTIKSLQPQEINSQIRKVLDAYSGVNAKLNAVFHVRKMENDVRLDPDFQRILNQPPRKDTVIISVQKPIKPIRPNFRPKMFR